jgi:uncharacterized ion transporter superfamily protein YfcC
MQALLRPVATAETARCTAPRRDLMPHPIVMMSLIVAAAMLLNWPIPSGRFDRAPDRHVIAGSFREIPKRYSLQPLFRLQHSTRETACPADLSALDAGTMRLVAATRGDVDVLTPVLMIALPRRVAILLAVGLGIIAIVYGAGNLHWGNPQFAAAA